MWRNDSNLTTKKGPRVYLLRRTLIIASLAILVYLFVLMVPVIPVQVFIPGTCQPFGCFILPHDKFNAVANGWTRSFLYSISYQLTGFGAHYNIDLGYSLPSGLYVQGLGVPPDFVVFWIIILPLILAVIICLATALFTGRRK